MTITFAQLISGLGMLSGLIIMCLGLVLRWLSISHSQAFAAARITLIGAALLAGSSVIYAVELSR